MKRIIVCIAMLMLLAACSTKKNTFTRRVYHNLTTHYNVFWNGRESFRKGLLDLEVAKVLERIQGRKFKIQLDEKAKNFLVEKGYDPQYGARPMRRAVERQLEDPLAEEILKGTLHEGEPVVVTADNDKLPFKQS